MIGVLPGGSKGPGLFRMRNLLSGALALGLVAGVYLGEWFPSLGGGLGLGVRSAPSSKSTSATTNNSTAEFNVGSAGIADGNSGSLRVVIKERSFFVRQGSQDKPIAIDALVAAIKSAKGDADGIRARVYRAGSARPTAEQQLTDALKAADVPESAVYVSAEPVE